jgi:hypothetical protein
LRNSRSTVRSNDDVANAFNTIATPKGRSMAGEGSEQ